MFQWAVIEQRHQRGIPRGVSNAVRWLDDGIWYATCDLRRKLMTCRPTNPIWNNVEAIVEKTDDIDWNSMMMILMIDRLVMMNDEMNHDDDDDDIFFSKKAMHRVMITDLLIINRLNISLFSNYQDIFGMCHSIHMYECILQTTRSRDNDDKAATTIDAWWIDDEFTTTTRRRGKCAMVTVPLMTITTTTMMMIHIKIVICDDVVDDCDGDVVAFENWIWHQSGTWLVSRQLEYFFSKKAMHSNSYITFLINK